MQMIGDSMRQRLFDGAGNSRSQGNGREKYLIMPINNLHVGLAVTVLDLGDHPVLMRIILRSWVHACACSAPMA